MATADAPALLHIVGYLTGASLFAMLLVMVLRHDGPGYRLTLGTALLGVGWNVGELSAHLFDALHLAGREWLSAASYGALGFLAAVVVHSAARSTGESETRSSLVRLVGPVAYSCAAIAAIDHLIAAGTHAPLPSPLGLYLLTGGLATLAAGLLWVTRHNRHRGRAGSMTALALFAISALHIGRFHGTSESWTTELLGHHASIPLAFAILYQDYRFAFADLFLKRALTLVVLVATVFVAWSVVGPIVATDPGGPLTVGLLLGLWILTALLFPWMQRLVGTFVDRVMLKRSNYERLLEGFLGRLQSAASEEVVLADLGATISEALGGAAVTTCAADSPGSNCVSIVTAEAPHRMLMIGALAGGRRLLSDDRLMLDRAATMAGRRLDALRLSDERYERMLREREISSLATEAELRALRAQINPHFLFNALTTLGYLIQHAPARAFDTLMRLTTLLRSVLRSEGEFTTLAHERDLIECYLQIEGERFEERLQTTIDIPETLADVAIPALIVQPLVENAIKHGISQSRQGGYVRVAARARMAGDETHLEIAVKNSGAPLRIGRSEASTGVGLRNVERRLRCYYGDGAAITLTRDQVCGETVATITLPVAEGVVSEAPVLTERSGS